MKPLSHKHLFSSGTAGAPGLLRRYVAMFAISLTLYGLCCQSGPAWQDSGIFQWRVYRTDLTGSMGLALAHPLLVILAKTFTFLPIGDLAGRINLFSAFCGAVASANVGLLAGSLTGRARSAWVAAGLFTLAHTTWWLSTICESQVLLVAVFTGELNVLVRLVRRPRTGKVVLLGLLSGLGWSTHNLALLALPAYGLIVLRLCARRRLSWTATAAFILAWMAGAAVLATLVIREAMTTGVWPAIQSVLFGRSWQGAVLGSALKPVGMGAVYILYNFPNLGLPLAAIGLWLLRDYLPASLRVATVYLLAAYFLFAIRYAVPDQFMFFLPTYALVAVLAGVGLGHAAPTNGRSWLTLAATASLAVGPVLYVAAPWAASKAGLTLPGRRDLPFRNPERYWLTPWKGSERSAEAFATRALADVPQGATIVADGTSFPPLRWMQQVEGLRRDVRVLTLEQASPDAVGSGDSVYVVSVLKNNHPEWMDPVADFDAMPDNAKSVLYHVRWRRLAGISSESGPPSAVTAVSDLTGG